MRPDPDTLQAHRLTQRAYVEFGLQDAREARSLLQRAGKLAPDDPIVANALNRILGQRAQGSPARL